MGNTPPAAGLARAPLLATLWLPVLVVAGFGTAALLARYSGQFLDDAYIGFRYVANLLSGDGFVFNPGERVEGVTNAGWLLLLLPLASLVGPPLAAKILGAACVVAAALLTAALLVRLDPTARPAMPVLAALLVLTCFEFTYFALAGMETGLLALLLLAALWLALDGRPLWLVLLPAALATAVRPEAVLVGPAALLALLALRRTALRQLAPALALFLLVVGTTTLLRYLYFDALLPNTFDAKPARPAQIGASLVQFATGDEPNIPFPFDGLPILLFLGLGLGVVAARSAAAAALAAGGLAAGYLFALYAEPDWTGLGRYFAPYVPLGFLLLLVGGQALERRFRGSPGTIAAAVAALLAAGGALNTLYQSSEARLGVFPGYVLAARPLIAPAEWMAENLPADAVIATRRIGAVAYVADRAVFDYSLGLTNREVARAIRRTGSRFWSPADPRLAEIWRARRPDYLLEDDDVLARIIAEVGGEPALFRIHGIPYRVIRSFPVGQRRWQGLFGPELRPVSWTLAARVAEP